MPFMYFVFLEIFDDFVQGISSRLTCGFPQPFQSLMVGCRPRTLRWSHPYRIKEDSSKNFTTKPPVAFPDEV